MPEKIPIDAPPRITEAGRRSRRQQSGGHLRSRSAWIGLAAALLVGGAAWWVLRPANAPVANTGTAPVAGSALAPAAPKIEPADPRPSPRDTPSQVGLGPAEVTLSPAVDPVFREQPIPDDGETLWASPTSGPPLSLAYLPNGTQVVLHLRPTDWTDHSEGERMLAALGPWGERVLAELHHGLGDDLRRFESLLVSWVVSEQGQLQPCYRAVARDEVSTAQIAKWMPGLRDEVLAGQSVQGRGETVWWLPETQAGKMLVVVPREVFPELVGQGETPPLLVRDIERMLARVDVDRAFSLVLTTRFLQAGGGDFFAGPGLRLYAACDRILGRDATALAVSADWDRDFFLELRITPQSAAPPHAYARQIRQRLAAAARQLEDLVGSAVWHPYGRRVIGRLPSMFRLLVASTRGAVEGDQAVLRCYLPLSAGHNLTMATELLLTQSAQAAAGDPPASDAGSGGGLSLADRLARPTSLVFTKDTLERALELLADDLQTPIEIRGNDLQLEGITKNQSFAIEARDLPLQDILVRVLLLANPDRTATGPDDPKQKLVYVIVPGAKDVTDSGGEQFPGKLVVTTRSAAARRGETLPAVFTTPPR